MSVEARVGRVPVPKKVTRQEAPIKQVARKIKAFIDLSDTPEARRYQPGEAIIADRLKTKAFISSLKQAENMSLTLRNINGRNSPNKSETV